MLKVVVIAALACFAFAERKSYEGYQVWTVYPESTENLEVLHNMIAREQLDARISKNPKTPVEMLVRPENIVKFRRMFRNLGIKIEVNNPNVQRSLDETYERLDAKLVYDPNDYNVYEDIMDELERLSGVCAEGVNCELEVIGQSIEGRDLVVFHMTQEGENRSGHMIDSLIHSREWLAGSTTLRILDYMVTAYGTDDEVTALVDTYDFHFLPVVNPDGYSYTFTNDRFWRKSRNENEGTSCIGTDLNRNFEYQWGPVGSSDNPCSDVYRGSDPASEPEVQAVQAHALGIASSLISYLSIHTTAYVWLSPYGYATENFECNDPVDLADIQQVGEAAIAAIEATNGDSWEAGTACDILYEANGVTVDYMYSIGIKYSYTPELRGPGFDPPPSAIEPSFEEVWNGYKALIAEIEAIEGL